MGELIKLLDENLYYEGYEIQGEELFIYVSSARGEAICPYCGQTSGQVHSRKVRTLKDLPMQGKKVKFLLEQKKYFCNNKACAKKHLRNGLAFLNPRQLKRAAYRKKFCA